MLKIENESYCWWSPYLVSKSKRCLDVLVCVVLLCPAAGLIALLFLLVLLFEGRPVFFVQRRAGKNGTGFWLPKIRTLDRNADPDLPSCQCDINSHSTVIGRFLRKYRLDELPQIFLVLTGKMSLVGPRPEIFSVVAEYSLTAKKRLVSKPGLTGLWQTRSTRQCPIHHDLKYDFYYLRKANFWLDIGILVETVFFMLGAKVR